MSIRKQVVLTCSATCLAFLPGLIASATEYTAPPDSSTLGGIVSRYTGPIQDLSIHSAEAPRPALPESPALLLECLSTADNDTYIGIHQQMIVHAPVAAVEKALDDVAHYKDMIDELLHAEIRDKKEGRYVVYSETHIPVPFVANERDEMIYVKDVSPPGFVRYRYQLKSSNHLKSNDGFIVLRMTQKPDETYYEEYDFWDADWGLAKTFGDKRIWKDCVEGIAQSDLAMKLRAENPSWSLDKVKDESMRARDALKVEACVKGRKPFQLQGASGITQSPRPPEASPSPTTKALRLPVESTTL